MRRRVAHRRIHGHPHLSAEHTRVNVGETEQRASIVGLEVKDLAVVALTHSEFAEQWRIASDLRPHVEVSNAPGAARNLHVQPAQRLTIVARDRAKPDIEVEVDLFLPRIRVVVGERGFNELPPVIDLAAHDDIERAVIHALGPQRNLVSAGERKDREIGGHDVAVGIELNRAPGDAALSVEREVVEPGVFSRGDEVEGDAGRSAGRLDPTRQELVDFGRREVGVHGDLVLAVVSADPPRQLDRNVAGHGGAKIDPEPAPRRLIEHGTDAQITLQVRVRFPEFDRRGCAIDPRIALDRRNRHPLPSPEAPGLRACD